jgi:signal peptidase I
MSAPPSTKAPSPSARSSSRETLEAALVAGLFLIFANTWVFRTFFIPSASMEQTLLVGDHLVVNRFLYGPAPTAVERALLPSRPIRRGDIVVFRSPRQPELDLVKRCVAMPGDLVEVRDKRLVLNGKLVDEPWAHHVDPFTGGVDSWNPDRIRRDQMPPLRVPPNHYFCMGDNRDQSLDSRFWGPVPVQLVKGRAGWIYWSYGAEAPPADWQGLTSTVRRWGRTAVGFFEGTRWKRTFHLPR